MAVKGLKKTNCVCNITFIYNYSIHMHIHTYHDSQSTRYNDATDVDAIQSRHRAFRAICMSYKCKTLQLTV